VIDADVLARAGEVFDLHPLRPVKPAQLALRRACVRRGGSVIDGNRHLRRLISLARWRFRTCGTGSAVRCRPRSTLTAVVALHTRGVVKITSPRPEAAMPSPARTELHLLTQCLRGAESPED
jgi:hypothetical protein